MYNSWCTVTHQCTMISHSRLQLQWSAFHYTVYWLMDDGLTWTIPKFILDTKMSVCHQTKKITFFQQKMFSGKKSYPLIFPILGGRDSSRALQSSPFQISGGRRRRRRKSSCLILGASNSSFYFLHPIFADSLPYMCCQLLDSVFGHQLVVSIHDYLLLLVVPAYNA